MLRDRYSPKSKNLILPSDGIIYAGNPFVDGTWRKIRDGDNWDAERREAGVWVKKSGDIA